MVVIVGIGMGLLVWTVMTVLVRGMDAAFDSHVFKAVGWILLTIFLFALIAAGGISSAILFTNLYSN